MNTHTSQTRKGNEDFDFLFDSRFKSIVCRDYEELTGLDSKLSTKSVLVLSGCLIEAALSDSLIATGDLTFRQVDEMKFEQIIEAAKEKGILKKNELGTVIRNYRNLVHPSREIKDDIGFDESDAELARSAAKVVLREVSKWTAQWRIQLRYKAYLEAASDEERFFLNLFGKSIDPGDAGCEHPWLSFGMRPIENLERNVVISLGVLDKTDYTQTAMLVPEAIAQIEKIVLKDQLKRNSIKLTYRNIASDLSGGSGATGSTR